MSNSENAEHAEEIQSNEEETEPFELNINLSCFPSRESNRGIHSLVESLQELYQDDLTEIGNAIITQMIDNNVLTPNKNKEEDEEQNWDS